MSPSNPVGDLADEIRPPQGKNVEVRIAVVTAVESAVGRRVQTDQTGTAWVSRSEDADLSIGDRVWLLQQGGVFIVGGRLSGEPGNIPVGTVLPFAGATPPPGWMIADGSAISRTTYATLFATSGTAYGAGNGTTTFNLPNLSGKFPLGASGSHPVGQSGGEEDHTLTLAEMPTHTHGATGAHTHQFKLRATAGTTSGGSGVSATTPGVFDDTESAGLHVHAAIGSGAAHNNMPPFAALLYIIRVL